jgi:small conductance mechanosensitive channel
VHTIPYSSAATVTNMTKEYSHYLVEVGVAYRESYDEVTEILCEVGEDLRADVEFGADILEPIDIMGLDRFEDSAVIVRARLKTTAGKQWGIGREYNRRLKTAFDARGIEMPFPHQTIYFGEDKEGRAPPAFINLKPATKSKPFSQGTSAAPTGTENGDDVGDGDASSTSGNDRA